MYRPKFDSEYRLYRFSRKSQVEYTIYARQLCRRASDCRQTPQRGEKSLAEFAQRIKLKSIFVRACTAQKINTPQGYLFLCIKIGCRISGEILALK
jgi:hypothetical protein